VQGSDDNLRTLWHTKRRCGEGRGKCQHGSRGEATGLCPHVVYDGDTRRSVATETASTERRHDRATPRDETIPVDLVQNTAESLGRIAGLLSVL
jgi:hypothetical protein